MKSSIRLFIMFIIVYSLSLNISAQSMLGSVRGVVIDARGGIIRGARVVLLYANKLAMRETQTNERGEFDFAGVKPGDYSVSVEAEGLTQGGGAQPVKVASGQVLRIAIPLTVAAIEDSVLVSATRTESRASETPTSAYIVSAADLLRSQRITVADALRSSPGVTVMQTGRRGGVTSLFVRGGESDYTKVLIDGVPVNDAGGSFDFADLTTDNAARIELVRSTQSAIYGSDAISGVLQVFTNRGTTSRPELEIAGEGGSFGFNRQLARLSGAARMFDYSLSYTHLRTDGRDRNDDYQNRISTANLGFRPNERTQLRVTARKDSSGLGVAGPTAVLFPDPDERARRKRYTVGARIDDQTTKSWHQSLTFAYSESKALNFDPAAQDLSKPDTPLDTGTAFNDFVSYFNNHQRRRGLRYQSDFVMAGGHLVTGGIDYEQERAVFDTGFTGQNRVASERTNAGVYLQDQFSWGPRLFVTAGIRYEHNSAKLPDSFAKVLSDLNSVPFTGEVGYGGEVVPKISAIYVLRLSGLQSRRGPTRLKFNYGRGFKSPTLLEAFSPSQFFLGNPGLRPERSRSFDVGIEQYFLGDKIRVEGFYFESRFRDQIAFVGDPASFGGPISLPDGRLTNFINFDRSRARGYEVALSWHPKQWLQFGGSYMLLKTKIEEAADVIDFDTMALVPNPEVGLPMLRRPRNSGNMYMNWTGKNIDVNVIGYFVGKRRDGDPVTFSRFDAQGRPIYNTGYARIDLTGAYRFTSWTSLFARVENLTNRDYQEVLGYPAYRLTFSAGMRFRFGGGR
jgi:vitamin B12 transporter